MRTAILCSFVLLVACNGSSNGASHSAVDEGDAAADVATDAGADLDSAAAADGATDTGGDAAKTDASDGGHWVDGCVPIGCEDTVTFHGTLAADTDLTTLSFEVCRNSDCQRVAHGGPTAADWEDASWIGTPPTAHPFGTWVRVSATTGGLAFDGKVTAYENTLSSAPSDVWHVSASSPDGTVLFDASKSVSYGRHPLSCEPDGGCLTGDIGDVTAATP